jgi:hypothetical protein
VPGVLVFFDSLLPPLNTFHGDVATFPGWKLRDYAGGLNVKGIEDFSRGMSFSIPNLDIKSDQNEG